MTTAPQFANSSNYLTALQTCNPKAFAQNAKELYQNCLDAKSDAKCTPKGYTHVIGRKFVDLSIPKIFVFGNSTHDVTQKFIKTKLTCHKTDSESHWVIQDCFEEFKKILHNFMDRIAILVLQDIKKMAAQRLFAAKADLSQPVKFPETADQFRPVATSRVLRKNIIK